MWKVAAQRPVVDEVRHVDRNNARGLQHLPEVERLDSTGPVLKPHFEHNTVVESAAISLAWTTPHVRRNGTPNSG